MKRATILGWIVCSCFVSAPWAQNLVGSRTLCETGCLLPPTGLVGWWTADGNTNDIQLGSNGNLLNGATFAPGLVRQAFSLDGIDDFIAVPILRRCMRLLRP
jgi:hypothetical protein